MTAKNKSTSFIKDCKQNYDLLEKSIVQQRFI